jgi:N-acetylmuramoyl-L-alanine amidase-like protein
VRNDHGRRASAFPARRRGAFPGKRTVRAATALVVAAVAALGPGGTARAHVLPPPECPIELDCRFVPAAAGHFAAAGRPRDGVRIRYIVIHDTEETYDKTIALFGTPGTGAAAHYLVRSADGQVTQFVPTRDIAYHAGNFWFNAHSIGIEHEGFLAQGGTWYTEAMYQSSARLVRWLAHRFDVPLDRAHILGHEEVPGQTPAAVPGMHFDPGPYWDWAHYFDLLRAPLTGPRHRMPDLPLPGPAVVVVAPRFEENIEPLQDCTPPGCVFLPRQGSNIVYLHTEPRPDAPLITDPDLHPDRTPGSTALGDWSARATTGVRYVMAARREGWTGIWFAGQVAWFADPDGCVGLPAPGIVVTPRPDRGPVSVYGAAYPEPGAYSPDAEITPIVPLQQTIPAGQFYVGLQLLRGDDYARTSDPDRPTGRVHTAGHRWLVEISFNHRRAFVDAADMVILG